MPYQNLPGESAMLKGSSLIYAAVALALAPCAAFAVSPFDGSWKVNLSHFQASKKPDVYVITATSFTCSSCGPAYTIKADGTDQKVMGHDFDTIAVTVTSTSVTSVAKVKGKTLFTAKDTISADGKTFSEDYTSNSGSQPIEIKATYTQVTPPAAGENALSGSWVQSKVTSPSDAALMETFGMTDDGFTFSQNGQSYDAKFDGKKYPLTGDPTGTMVTLKKLGPSSVEESDYQNGKLVDVARMNVSADGKTMHVTDHNIRNDHTVRYTLTKQP
jgi:hypothetical protein